MIPQNIKKLYQIFYVFGVVRLKKKALSKIVTVLPLLFVPKANNFDISS